MQARERYRGVGYERIEKDWMFFGIGKDNGDPRGREAEEWPMRLG